MQLMNRSVMETLVNRVVKCSVAVLSLGSVAACMRPGYSDTGYLGGKSGASLTDIDMNMPEASAFESRSQELAELIRTGRFGYRLQISPKDSSCTGATSIDQTAVYGANLSLSSSIRQGCDYSLTVELGGLSNSQSSLSKVYFRNDPVLPISRADIDGKANFQASVVLKSVAVDNEIQPNNPAPDTNYPDEKDVDVKNAAGATVKLSSLFHGEYLLLDFSQSGCGACVTLARNLEQDADFQRAFNGQAGSCAFATVVPGSDRTNWLNRFPATGKTGSHTVAPLSGGFSAVARKFGYTVRATPTMLLINNRGELIDEGVGRIPSKVQELCNM